MFSESVEVNELTCLERHVNRANSKVEQCQNTRASLVSQNLLAISSSFISQALHY